MQTIGKIFFASIFLGGMLCVIGVILGATGVLPHSLYVTYYQLEETLAARTGASSWPSMQQFEGHWSVEGVPVSAESDIGTCVPLKGYIVSHNGAVTGTLHSFNPYANIDITAAIQQNGAVAGTMTGSTQYTGSFKATFANGQGSGTWQDSIDCSGTITFTKIVPAVDPVAGQIVSTSGRVTLGRNGQTLIAYPGTQLYAGDILTASGGASAHLGIGLGNVSTVVPSGQSYEVPNLPGQ